MTTVGYFALSFFAISPTIISFLSGPTTMFTEDPYPHDMRPYSPNELVPSRVALAAFAEILVIKSATFE